jgi:hypothetical protein
MAWRDTNLATDGGTPFEAEYAEVIAVSGQRLSAIGQRPMANG